MSKDSMFGYGTKAEELLATIRGAVVNGQFRRALIASARRRVADNRWPIIVSLALATVIYYGIHERPTEEFVRNVAVKVRGVPEGRRIGIEPPTVRAVFKGSRADMLGLDMAPPVIYVNYPGAAQNGGEDGVSVKLNRKRNVHFPGMRGFGSVSVERLEPDGVRIVEDESASIGFEIDPPRLEGTPYRGYKAKVVDYSPKKATVTGGRRRLKGWDELGYKLQLAPISVEGRAVSFFEEVDILPPAGEDAMDLALPTTKVKVEVAIVPPRDSLTFDEIPVRLSFPQGYGLPREVVVEPKSVKATLVGVKEQLSSVAAGNVVVYAEIAEGAPPLSETNALAVTLVARVPQDKSIFEVNIDPPEARLLAAPEETPEEKPESLDGLEHLVDLESPENAETKEDETP